MEDSDVSLSNNAETIIASIDSFDRVNKIITSTISSGSVLTADLLELEIKNFKIHNPGASGSYDLPIRTYNNVGSLIEYGTGTIILENVYQQVEVNIEVQQSLQLSVDSGSVLLEVDPDVQMGQNWVGIGGLATDKTNVTVKTNAQSGYNLMIQLN